MRFPSTTLPKTKFPDTKYMGSKQSILPAIISRLDDLEFSSVLDAFSGSACVSYALKQSGKAVTANDFLQFAFHTARATVENSQTKLSEDDLSLLLWPNPSADSFVRDTFAGLYFSHEDCEFLDRVSANVSLLGDEFRRSLALAALCRACMKKRPRGIFTFVGKKGWDGRRDLQISMREQFLDAVNLLNDCVFDNAQSNRAVCQDVFDVPPGGFDLVYIDPPYLSPHSDADYTRRYHFLEGLCCYWQGVALQANTVTKKMKSYPTEFRSVKTAHAAFLRLFQHFRGCKLAVSYSSNAVPSRDELATILRSVGKQVEVLEIPYRYCFGNHAHKVGNNNNLATEYLFIAT